MLLGFARRAAGSRLALGVGAGALAGAAYLGPRLSFTEAPPAVAQPSAAAAAARDEATGGGGDDARKWPIFSRAEVAKHATKETGIWVIYEDGVFDITDFVDNHPGGSRILLGAGKSIDAFWNLYRQHLNTEGPMQMLLEMQIGKLDPKDVVAPSAADLADPYANDPPVSPLLIVHGAKPLQAETPAGLLTDSWLTPTQLWFVRGHHPVPRIEAEAYTLTVRGRGLERAFTFTLAELQARFAKHEVTSTLQCGGNGRSNFNAVEKTIGIPWGCGAISTAKWGGARLVDVLAACGLDEAAADALGVEHVQFEGAEAMCASIPAAKALARRGDVLLAYEMNGQPIPPEHGYPVRAIVPGHVGVRNVKWLASVVTSSEEAEGAWQRGISYKGFAPALKSFEGVDVEAVPSVQEQPVMSAITAPAARDAVGGEAVECRGFAWSGGGRGIVRVDVSADGGATWTTARLREGAEQPIDRAWAWTFWQADVPLPPHAQPGDELTIVAKATDAAYNTQPERAAPIWNVRGINYNAWPRVKVVAADP